MITNLTGKVTFVKGRRSKSDTYLQDDIKFFREQLGNQIGNQPNSKERDQI